MRVPGWWVTSVALGLALATGACSGDTPGGPMAEIVDSAGIRLVTYDLADVVVEPFARVGGYDLEIGSLDGRDEYLFSRIIDLRTADDGAIKGGV